MKDWTVSGSSDFDTSRQQHFADFLAKLAAYTGAPKGKSAKQLQEAIASYRHFLEKLKKLEDQNDKSVLPENELAYIQDNPKGIPIYSLIHKNWRCLYLVDTKKKTCTAIKIESMSDNLRNVEEDRHKYGKRLKSVR